MDISYLIKRETGIFNDDISNKNDQLKKEIKSSRFLILGGGGSIGQAVAREIFKRGPKKLHVVDINENSLVELTRDLRSSFGYIEGDFQVFVLDIGSDEYNAFYKADGKYDYVLNLAALKHVRSEKDPFTLMRMINVNILSTDNSLRQAIKKGTKKYFCVSTDKATKPINMMGASKKIMEMFLMQNSSKIEISSARFANVAFSDGSLLDSFKKRLEKKQPIVAPKDIRRYFITPQEAGELCILSCIFGKNRDIFIPKLNKKTDLISLKEIALKYISKSGYKPYLCEDENQARELAKSLPDKGKWPCLFSRSNTTGEKEVEEFFTDHDVIDHNRFRNISVIKNDLIYDKDKLNTFKDNIIKMKKISTWNKKILIENFKLLIPNFNHKETGKYLNDKM